jgi:uridylate kinase
MEIPSYSFMLVVLKLGGSVAFPGRPDVDFIESFAKTVGKAMKEGGHRIAIVVGAGAVSRGYTSPLRGRAGMNEAFLDELGIDIARVNARIISKFVKGKYVETLREAGETIEEGLIPVMGGLIPGQSTDAVAAVLAEYLEADRLVVLTNVDGIFTDDPKKKEGKKEAHLIKTLSFDELRKTCENLEYKASDYPVFDFVAAKIVARSRIKTHVANGKNVKNLSEVLDERIGTTISDEKKK